MPEDRKTERKNRLQDIAGMAGAGTAAVDRVLNERFLARARLLQDWRKTSVLR